MKFFDLLKHIIKDSKNSLQKPAHPQESTQKTAETVKTNTAQKHPGASADTAEQKTAETAKAGTAQDGTGSETALTAVAVRPGTDPSKIQNWRMEKYKESIDVVRKFQNSHGIRNCDDFFGNMRILKNNPLQEAEELQQRAYMMYKKMRRATFDADLKRGYTIDDRPATYHEQITCVEHIYRVTRVPPKQGYEIAEIGIDKTSGKLYRIDSRPQSYGAFCGGEDSYEEITPEEFREAAGGQYEGITRDNSLNYIPAAEQYQPPRHNMKKVSKTYSFTVRPEKIRTGQLPDIFRIEAWLWQRYGASHAVLQKTDRGYRATQGVQSSLLTDLELRYVLGAFPNPLPEAGSGEAVAWTTKISGYLDCIAVECILTNGDSFFLSECSNAYEIMSRIGSMSLNTIHVMPQSVADREDKLKEEGFEVFDGRLDKYTGAKKSITLPRDVTDISFSAFDPSMGRTPVSDIVIPDGVKFISDYAFRGCKELKEISIPDSVTFIGRSAFQGCTSLRKVKLPKKLTKISRQLFDGCTFLESIDLPASVVTIENFAFRGCTNLKNITVHTEISYLGQDVFKNCPKLHLSEEQRRMLSMK